MLGTCHQDPSVMSTIVINDAVSPRFDFCGFCNRLGFTDSSTPLFSISELCCIVICFVLVHAISWFHLAIYFSLFWLSILCPDKDYSPVVEMFIFQKAALVGKHYAMQIEFLYRFHMK